MDLSSIPLFEALAKRMNWLNRRQTVLAENVANADTPGYVARDLKPPSFGSLLPGKGAAPPLQLAATDPGHLAPKRSHGGFSEVKTPAEQRLDGNAVSLEEQMLKVSQNASDYALMTNLYRKQVGMFQIALDKSSGG